MLCGHNIICFAPNDWWGMNPSCTTHIMRGLAERNRVLWINPFSSDLSAGGRGGSRRGLGVRIRRKLGSLARYLRRPHDRIHVFSPLFVPIQGRRAIDVLNNVFLRLQIKVVCTCLGFRKPIVWYENVRAADLMDGFSPLTTVYHVSDLFAVDSYTSSSQRQKEREAAVSANSRLLICVSRELYEQKKREHQNVHYVPHGVDFDLFRNAAEDPRVPAEIAGIPRPIVGYYGTMTGHNDIEMMDYCAENLPHVSFVFAGQITAGDYTRLGARKNVFLIGRVPYERIPHLCASFDVCMLQWRMSEWIRKCNPLKMLEYMASGRPIVSVQIAEAMRYSDVISIADDKETFCKAIEWELKNDTAERREKRIEIASQHSWAKHVDHVSSLIQETIHDERSVP
ncbi:glycosyltransferase [Anaerobaca lacustris]|uniref:Glycosyltransferase n=1 Tax=Anaerobaca lacustris TaxID=3044600 RepID=A0AAW6TVL8_9BACT|nr:glycosyltransferase [Sedimentisphaerales bacterium M17dextr]